MSMGERGPAPKEQLERGPRWDLEAMTSGGKSLSCQPHCLSRLLRLPESPCPLSKGEDEPYPVLFRSLARIMVYMHVETFGHSDMLLLR